MNKDVPEWLMEYAQDVRRLLGIGDDWHIWISMVDQIDDNDEAAGEVDLDWPYLRATIKIRKELPSEDAYMSAIFHELLHVALAPIDHMTNHLIMRLPESRSIQTYILKSDAFEQTITRLERALRANVRPVLT